MHIAMLKVEAVVYVRNLTYSGMFTFHLLQSKLDSQPFEELIKQLGTTNQSPEELNTYHQSPQQPFPDSEIIIADKQSSEQLDTGVQQPNAGGQPLEESNAKVQSTNELDVADQFPKQRK